MSKTTTVRAWTEDLVLPTYLPAPPDKNPMFLEKRVYQGSSGKVYPLPFTDRIAEKPVDRKWKAVWIENEFLRVLVLPEIGGRIHRVLDKTNNYDLIYYQPVIKPALVGLAGPWISGGIEFNWPQHHRPATFLPVDTEMEKSLDGSVTIWCSDHDPMCRMKGMHGICLHPGRAYLELKVRAYNRTPFRQTFLWWANVATRVHEAYQSFFPPDVYYVADHARRSMSEYPLAQGHYYGVNYGERGRKGVPPNEVPAQFVPPHSANPPDIGHRASGIKIPDAGCQMPDYAPNDLSFYANIPVPTSYMCMGSKEDFFGGYDYKAQAGIVHIANHHLSPGKKQWTWGNHEFGYAWDRNLTDADASGEFAPYIEIMAGVFTDNQPDFSFLQPGETRSWSQYWYPIQKIGPVQHANLDAAVNLILAPKRFQLGVCVTGMFRKARVRLERADGSVAAEWQTDLAPGKPFVLKSPQASEPWKVGETVLRVLTRDGIDIIAYQPKPRAKGEVPPPATEPPAPSDIASADELFVTGLHLEQYRHATRCPTLYWREAVRRDPLDARCNNALGLWHLKRGEFKEAEAHFRTAIERLTRRNANPADGEPYYNFGLCLRYQADALGSGDTQLALRLLDESYSAFYKATWNQAWAGPSYHALAEIDCRRQDWAKATEHAERAYQASAYNQRVMNLWAIALKKRGEEGSSATLLRAFRRRDPLDGWTRHLLGEPLTCDAQTYLDIAHDLARAGFHAEAIRLLETQVSADFKAAHAALPDQSWGTAPLIQYMLGWLHGKLGNAKAALQHFQQAAALPPDYCFPARLEEIAILEAAMSANPKDARAPYYLGNLLYDRRRHAEAIRLWEKSAALDPTFSIVWRNLGIGCFNIRRQPAKARAAYERAFLANPQDPRLLFEHDQLWKRLGEKPEKRLRALEKRLDLVRQRDDLSVELCALHNQTGQHEKALALVSSRHFQPWEGGEGGPLGQWVRSHLALGRAAFAKARGSQDDKARSSSMGGAAGEQQSLLTAAAQHFRAALTAPRNLGEAKHLLANQSDIHYWLGCALDALGDKTSARQHWHVAATFKGDFQEMSVRAFSEMTYYSALAWERLGQKAIAKELLHELLAFAQMLQKTEAKIDYFATSLPTMLLFDDDLQLRQETTALFLQAQACLGLSRRAKAKSLLATVLQRDPNHALAADLLLEISAGRSPDQSPNFGFPPQRPDES